MNPGGPGGSGLDAAWGIRPGMPADVLRAYDIVSWDPRGIGSSTPAIDCGPDPDPNRDDFMQACADGTGDLGGVPVGARTRRPTSRRSASRSARTGSTTSATATARSSAPPSPPTSPTGSATSCSTERPTRSSVATTASSRTASRTTRPTGRRRATDRFVELCDLSDACLADMGGDTRAAPRRTRRRRSTTCRPTTSPASRTPSTRSTFEGVFQSALAYAVRLAAVRHRASRRPRRRRVRARRAGGRGSAVVGGRIVRAGRAVVPGRQPRDLLRRLRRAHRRVDVLRSAAAQRVHHRADRIGRRRPADPGDRHRVRSGDAGLPRRRVRRRAR